jgi:DNA-binding SARP family transcriptional activator
VDSKNLFFEDGGVLKALRIFYFLIEQRYYYNEKKVTICLLEKEELF